MTHADLITFNRFVARLPATFGRVPRMLRGLYYTAIRNREKSLSLGWALERAARLYPDNPAVLDASGGSATPCSTAGPIAWRAPSRPRA